MELIRDSVSLAHLQELAAAMYGDLVKAVVDVKGETMVIGGELHSDEEAMLLDHGAGQANVWGINLYPGRHGTPDFIEYDSMINVRPSQGNRSRSVEDVGLQAEIARIVEKRVR